MTRIAAFGGPYANPHALSAMLGDAHAGRSGRAGARGVSPAR
jgi:hypothetical protein